MAWVPSHQELRDHPKTRKAARRAGVSLPAMIGHLHMLWWWALDHAPEGDLSKFDAEDLADAVMWEGDPETFVKALRDCGSGSSAGFLTDDGRLHDWDEYGGRYGKRVRAARKAAAVRWHSHDDADAMPTHDDRNANASQPQSNGNAEERREEKRRETTTSDVPSDPDVSDDARTLTRQFAKAVKANGHAIPTAGSKARDSWLVDMDRLLRLGPPGEGGHVPDVAEVARVIDWCAADTGNGKYPGESVTVRSVSKFRERYSELRRKAGFGGRTSGPDAKFFAGVPDD